MTNLPEYKPPPKIHPSALSGLVVTLSFTIEELDKPDPHTNLNSIQFVERLEHWVEHVIQAPTTLLENEKLLRGVVQHLRQTLLNDRETS